MRDERESKLPKWAQELLEAERIRAAFAWPNEAEPEPLVVFDANGNVTVGSRPEPDTKLWQAVPSGHVVKWVFNGNRVFHSGRETLHTPVGRYYATEPEATLALRWVLCREFALRLYLTIQ